MRPRRPFSTTTVWSVRTVLAARDGCTTTLYSALRRARAGLARVAALTFLGARIESWPEDRREGLAKCFQGVSYKRTLEWKEGC